MGSWEEELIRSAGYDPDDPELLEALDDAARYQGLMLALRQIRRSQELKQEDVAKRMGTTQSRVSSLEQLGGDPRISTLQRYARALGTRLVISAPVPTREVKVRETHQAPMTSPAHVSSDWTSIGRRGA